MFQLNWNMSRTRFYVDVFFSISFFVIIQVMVFYLISVSVVDDSPTLVPGSSAFILVLSMVGVESLAWVLVLSYRVTEIGEVIVLSSVFGQKKIIDITKIDSMISIFKFMFYLKFDDGKKCLLWNHMDGGSQLEIAWKDKKNKGNKH